MGVFDFLGDIDVSTLSSGLRKELVKQGAYSGLKSGLSSTQTKIDLRNNGLSFGNDAFSEHWQNARESSIGFQHVTEIGLNDGINIRNLPSSKLLTKPFGAIVKYDVFDEEGNFISEKTVRIDLDDLTTPADILNSAMDYLSQNYPISDEELDTLKIVGAMRQA